jgi:DNA-binding transcriptional LysR family regulator
MALMIVELRDIDYFAVVAQHAHLGRAAEALGLGQPALSMSLRRLEQSAQAKLVKRTPKGVELTAVGTALLSHASKLRLARDDLAREVADLARGSAGHLRIGASPSNVDVALPQACSTLLMQAPKITMNVAVLENDALLPALRKGDLDIALTHTRQSSLPDIALERLRDDEFVVYCAANHRLVKRKSVTLEHLAQERWAVASSASGTFGPLLVLRGAFEERALPPPRVALVSDLVMFRLRAVAGSDLLGIAVKPNIHEAAARLRLKVLPVERPEWVRRVVIAHRKDGYLSPAARRFVNILKTSSAVAGAE